MKTTDENKYRKPNIRQALWDYRRNAVYFVTMCTKKRTHYFGEVEDGVMKLNTQGAIADVLWHEIKNHFDHIILEAFVIMPNHVHGVVIINNPEFEAKRIEAISDEILSSGKTIAQTRFQNIGEQSISSIVGSYKSAVTKHLNRLRLPFAWQRQFHDNIIDNDQMFQKVKSYIENNPINWREDKFYNL